MKHNGGLNMKNKIVTALLLISMVFIMSGCEMMSSKVHDLSGDITGHTYNAEFYSNTGEKFMTAKGDNINLESNVVREPSYSSEGWGYVQTLSSVVTVTIDGHQMESCGSTAIFAEDTLSPDVDFSGIEEINSSSDGSLSDTTAVAGLVNRYKNAFGKPQVVVIQSQLGNPICAYSGEKVYWEVCEDLPKTTKLMIDGKALYIHRANFQIIDRALL